LERRSGGAFDVCMNNKACSSTIMFPFFILCVTHRHRLQVTTLQVTQASASTAGRIGAALLHALGEQSGIARTSSE